jgi:hypothetical protein
LIAYTPQRRSPRRASGLAFEQAAPRAGDAEALPRADATFDVALARMARDEVAHGTLGYVLLVARRDS